MITIMKMIMMMLIRIIIITHSFLVYDHDSGEQRFCDLPAKNSSVMWGEPLISFSFSSFNYYFLKWSDSSTELMISNHQLGTLMNILCSSFDGMMMKFGIISICPVALSCFTFLTSFLVPWKDHDKLLQIFCNISSCWAD